MKALWSEKATLVRTVILGVTMNVSMSDLIGQWLAQYHNKKDETEFS